MGNTVVALSLDRVFRAVGETYGSVQEKDLRYFLGSYGLRDKDSLSLVQGEDGEATASLDLQLSSGPIKGILRFSKSGNVSESVSSPNFSFFSQKMGRPNTLVTRFLFALAFGPQNLDTPLSDEETKLFAGAKLLYDNPTPYDKRADLTQKIANQLLFAARMIELADQEGNAGELRTEFSKKVGQLDTDELPGLNNNDALERRALVSSLMVGTFVQMEAGARACAKLGRCLVIAEHPTCTGKKIEDSARYHYVYRGVEIFAVGRPLCADPQKQYQGWGMGKYY
ncbi:MAG: hypothetical protein HY877_06850 [Deltaproteobacteria bacterium]|nr:hypothetical protein [Deltaproteobacteria bacterium]